jgi:hypothetical protein
MVVFIADQSWPAVISIQATRWPRRGRFLVGAALAVANRFCRGMTSAGFKV